jgi:hypothetical protein
MKTNSNSNAVLVPAAKSTAATNAAVGSDIRDIKGPVDIPSGWAWLWWALGVAALLALLVVVARRWMKPVRTIRPPPLPLPPEVRARRRLNEALALIGQPEPFCTLVSDTLRVYLEERFRFHAPDRTTEEFLDELQSSPMLSLPQKQSLGDFLVRCDLVKFARYEPGEPELRALHDAAVRLVDETAPPSLSSNTGASRVMAESVPQSK